MSNLDNPKNKKTKVYIDSDDKPERPLLSYAEYLAKAGIKKPRDYYLNFKNERTKNNGV